MNDPPKCDKSFSFAKFITPRNVSYTYFHRVMTVEFKSGTKLQFWNLKSGKQAPNGPGPPNWAR